MTVKNKRHSITDFFIYMMSFCSFVTAVFLLFGFIWVLRNGESFLLSGLNGKMPFLFMGFVIVFLFFSLVLLLLRPRFSYQDTMNRVLMENAHKEEIYKIASRRFGTKLSYQEALFMTDETRAAGKWVIERFENDETIVAVPTKFATKRRLQSLVPESNTILTILRRDILSNESKN